MNDSTTHRTSPPSEKDAAYFVLARKYRPKIFADLMGQEALVRTLTNAFAANRIAHAFMLTGVRGVGKTTTARIIAKGLNCVEGPTITPCNVCESCVSIAEGRCVDVLEMDAASRTGVEDIREIIDGVKYAPTSVRTKVYIIDEVHMLSKNAFNALLKTLEEPPPHVIFIFATTEIRKVPITVLSRCQRFDLRRLTMEELMALFTKIADAEAVEIDQTSKQLIARAADGSARDGLSLLDQAISQGGGTINAVMVRTMLGLADQRNVLDILSFTLDGNAFEALQRLNQLHTAGADALIVLQDMLQFVHQLSRFKILPEGKADTTLSVDEQKGMKELAEKFGTPALARAWQVLLKGIPEVQMAPQPMAALEMLLIRLAHIGTLPSPGELIKKLSQEGAQSMLAGQTLSTSSAAAQGPQSFRTVRLQQSNTGTLSAVSKQPAEAPSPAQHAHIALNDWRSLATLISNKREMTLYGQIYNFIECQNFAYGRLTLYPRAGAHSSITTRLSQLLSQWTNQPWMISIAQTSSHLTLAEEDEATHKNILAEAHEHPLVKAVLLAFPGSKLENVRDVIQIDENTRVPPDTSSPPSDQRMHDESVVDFSSHDHLSEYLNDESEED